MSEFFSIKGEVQVITSIFSFFKNIRGESMLIQQILYIQMKEQKKSFQGKKIFFFHFGQRGVE